jgi:hypothetical protein
VSAAKAEKKSAGGGDIVGKFGAWWNGKEYVAPSETPADEGATASAPAKLEVEAPKKLVVVEKTAAAPQAAEASPAAFQPTEVRLKALSTIWGEGRFTPGAPELDSRLLDPIFELADKAGDIGFIGCDPALLKSCASRSSRVLRAAEWRTACLAAVKQECPDVQAFAAEIDRPKAFADGSLEGLVSMDAFAYADHKAGLVARAHRALSATGCWVFLDTVRTTNKTPPTAFASAWAEPHVTTAEDIESLLTMAGFKSIERISATDEIIYASRAGYARLAYALEEAATGGFKGREGALFLQELAWEAETWRARCRAFEGGALGVDVWIARKTEADLSTKKLSQAEIEDLF